MMRLAGLSSNWLWMSVSNVLSHWPTTTFE